MKWLRFAEIIEGLTDWEFRKAITPTIIRVLYVLGLILSVVMTVNYIAASFQVNQVYGILATLLSGIVFFFFVLVLRVVLEILMALFKGASTKSWNYQDVTEEPEAIKAVETEVTENKKSISTKKQE